ncbi:transcription-repair coupling factor Mfd [Desulfocapsa sulfexigens DSM 10523]|uniref:Transcription-repair-coupling factor n=2 Tax=Desulfocapsa TaxID=53318 RepID=M1P920_DESSD|nr:transcription-repair coupling factor Mfd [Desulfocapsa sulfexigens DSM 10523]
MHTPFSTGPIPCSTALTCSSLRGNSKILLAALQAEMQTCCCIVPDEEMVVQVEEDLKLFTNRSVLTYPGYEIPAYTPLSPDPLTTAARLSTLYRLHETVAKNHSILVVSAEALMRRTMPAKFLFAHAELLLSGEECDRDDLFRKLNNLGYEQVNLVQSVGDYSIRGGIIDIFPPSFQAGQEIHTSPIRLDFFGDTIESLRGFNPISQRSICEIDEAIILPASDISYPSPSSTRMKQILNTFDKESSRLAWGSDESLKIRDRIASAMRFPGMEFFLPVFYPDTESVSSLFDFLPKDTCLIHFSPEMEEQARAVVQERINNNYEEAKSLHTPALDPNQIFLPPEETREKMASFANLHCSTTTDINNFHTLTATNHQILKQDISLQRKERGLVPPLSDQIHSWQNQGDTVVLCCRSLRQTKTLAELLERHQHTIELLESPIDLKTISRTAGCDILYLCDQPLSEGFSLTTPPIHFLSESELFGEMRIGNKKKTKEKLGESIRFTELHDGDVVVHRDHGLGLYLGMATLTMQGVVNDYMCIEYRDGDKLYLPVDRLNLISRYEGLSDKSPRIDKLGTASWRAAKAKVKEEVWKVAEELLEIYARRELREGRRFSPPGELYHELEESFPFDETVGQDKAITDVISDLTSDQPMDRLVCGDVGYGKTEVAVRAAFKVVEDGAQVAILVPTTVLAEQHAKTFRERMQGFPVTVECINRFRTAAQQKRIIKELATGEIDIIIGTHRLLSKDVSYRELGLLIIDEEHRFGVSHKEKIKRIKSEVDILTLTATPIPRTLQMSLLSIRDLSVISSPPEHRRPVKTFVARYDDLVIKEAVLKELRRGGQVFFVHNRVKSIYRMASKVQELVPEARIAVAHGQMNGKELEEIMVRFVNREIDVLVATTIIESGLDIPSANTMIINRADTLGLAEIYQLRGRVGRSSSQAFAYLLVPSLDNLSKDSKDRLRALMESNELGGGFKLAMSDLQIRGGGNLLGVSQSGHITAIGYDLYLDLLQKTVADMKARAAAGGDTAISDDTVEAEINLQISAYIPETYIPDISQRYVAYRRISALSMAETCMYEDLLEELDDRYGPVPEETHNLFKIVALKKELALLGVSKLEKGKDTFVFSFTENTPLDPRNLLAYLQNGSKKRKAPPRRLTPDGRLIIPASIDSSERLFTVLRHILTELNGLTQ